MLRDEAINLIAQRLGNRQGLADQILVEMKLAQVKLEMNGYFWPWFLLTERAETNTTVGDERVKTPQTFLGEYEDGGFFIYLSSEDEEQRWKGLIREDWQSLKKEYGEKTGEPKYYALAGDYFRLIPVPDKIYPCRMLFYGRDTVLTNNIENKWLKWAPEWLIGETGRNAAMFIQNPDMASLFAAQAQEGMDRMWRETENRHSSNADTQMRFS